MNGYLSRQRVKARAARKMEQLARVPSLVEEISQGDEEIAAKLEGKSYAELICIKRGSVTLPGLNYWNGDDDEPQAS